MTPPQRLRPLSSTRALLTSPRATPRESVVGGGVILAGTAVIAGIWAFRRSMRVTRG